MGRKHYTNQNVVVIVDFDLKFIYVLARWEVSYHDASNIADNLAPPNGLKILEGGFYLGDVEYACHPCILTPIRSTSYHLNSSLQQGTI
jgi:hypothetical protein